MLRRLARPLLGAAFVAGGVEALRDGDRRARKAGDLGLSNAPQVTRAVALTQVGAGALLVIGRLPRLSSLALALTVVPDAATGHAFWTETDKQDRQAQRSMFVRELGLLGGALVAAGDTGGRESVPHRARRTAGNAGRAAKRSGRKAAKQIG